MLTHTILTCVPQQRGWKHGAGMSRGTQPWLQGRVQQLPSPLLLVTESAVPSLALPWSSPSCVTPARKDLCRPTAPRAGEGPASSNAHSAFVPPTAYQLWGDSIISSTPGLQSPGKRTTFFLKRQKPPKLTMLNTRQTPFKGFLVMVKSRKIKQVVSQVPHIIPCFLLAGEIGGGNPAGTPGRPGPSSSHPRTHTKDPRRTSVSFLPRAPLPHGFPTTNSWEEEAGGRGLQTGSRRTCPGGRGRPAVGAGPELLSSEGNAPSCRQPPQSTWP